MCCRLEYAGDAMMHERAWLINEDNSTVYDRLGDVAAILTDPPYGAETHNKDRTGRNADGIIVEAPIPFVPLADFDRELLSAFACQNCHGWSLIFSQDEHLLRWRNSMETLIGGGTRYFRSMIWLKPNAKPNLNGDGPGKGHEMIASFWGGSGRPKWNGGGKLGVFIHNRPAKPCHPTEKPVPLMKELVRLFTNPGDVIFDPFMGSGSTGVAALELGRRFIGVEKNPEYFALATRRVREALAQNVLLPESDRMPTLFGGASWGSTGTRRRLAREAQERVDAQS
jgi:site-specific DNA-methyltransferase (adenine-specific)